MTPEEMQKLNDLEKVEIYSAGDLCDLVDLQTMRLKEDIDAGKAWDNWSYNPSEPPSIDYTPYRYEIVLMRIANDGDLGAWLLHLVDKQWITAEDIGNLVLAITDLEQVGYHVIARNHNP